MSPFLRPWDALELLVVAATIYLIVLTLRAARALHFAGALVGLVLLSWASHQLDLRVTAWLMDHFWPFWILGLIVVFQPELRRFLMQVGQSPLLGGMTRAGREAQGHVLDDVVKAADSLAAKRIGALVVLERSVGLDHYAELGVPLDALVSADLVVSLFLPYSPLHDGAVVIQGTRVAAAACFLPLTVNPELSRQLGSRHRAAIGVTEDTDALAVVVSEETGVISLTVDGVIERGLDPDRLQERLSTLLDADGTVSTRGSSLLAGVRRFTARSKA